MEKYIAMLRGINVSGKNMIKMELLKNCMEDMGCHSVKTYIQSGNIIFDYPNSNALDLAKQIKETINKDFGLDVPVIMRPAEDFPAILSKNPFINERQENIDYLHVTFLGHIPDPQLVKKLETSAFLPDECVVYADLVYLFCPGGYGNTKLNNNFFERKLKVEATTRNWKTVCKLAELDN